MKVSLSLQSMWSRSSKGLMARLLVVLSLVVTGLLAAPWGASADAAEPLAIKNLKVSVWPEYDDERVLVMYEGSFADGSVFPKGVKFLAAVGSELKQVCAITKPQNEHECQTFKALEEDGYLAVTYTLPIPTFFVEYYYPGVQGEGAKSLNFRFKAPYDVETLEVEVQQPLRSSGWTISPTASSVSSDAQGFKYYHYTMANIAAGKVIGIDASYTKTDSKPSVAPASTGQSDANSRTPLVVAMVVGLAALGGVSWLTLSGRRKPARRPAPAAAVRRATVVRADQAPARSIRDAPTVNEASPNSGGRAAFCAHCGLKLLEDDLFCPECGTKARRNG